VGEGSVIEWSSYARFLLALILVLGMILALTWALRRFGLGQLIPQNRGYRRVRRLSVIETANLDVRRRLVLIRRDDMEHLLLIGGSVDVEIGQSWPAKDFTTALAAEQTTPTPILHPEPTPKRKREPRRDVS